MRFTVCALFFGDYPLLAERLLSSLRPLFGNAGLHFRLAGNDVCTETRIKINAAAGEIGDRCELFYASSVGGKTPKYVTMRRMFHDSPLRSPLVMWFDDDSYLTAAKPEAWLNQIEAQMRSAHVLGKVYTMIDGLIGNQHLWIRSRPWYAGKAVARGLKTPFATGGWWTARTELLQKWRWPDEEVVHNGGDVMLGELCRQQDYTLAHFHQGVEINKADRRGLDCAPVGAHYRSAGA